MNDLHCGSHLWGGGSIQYSEVSDPARAGRVLS